MADELTDEQVFGSQPVASKELSDAEVFGAKPTQETPKDLTWSQVATSALKSTPSSAMEFGKALVEPILHPIDTATAFKNLGLGVAQKLGIAAPGEEEKVADALAAHFWERYGGIEKIKQTLAKDPVGFLADASSALTIAGLAIRAPGALAKGVGAVTKSQRLVALGEMAQLPGKAVQFLGSAVDPLAATARGVGYAGSKLMAIPSETVQAAERLGVQLPAAAASEGNVVPSVAGALKEIPIVGAPLAAGARRSLESLEAAVDNVVQQLGSGRATKAGDLVRASTEAWVRGQGGISGKIQSRLYDAVDNLVSHQYFEPLNNTSQVAQNINARRAQARLGGTSKAVDEVLDAIQNPNGINYPGLKDLRSYVGSLMDDKDRLIARNIDAGELKQIYGALTEDLKNVVQGAGGIDAVKAFEKANNVAKLVANRRDELKRLLGVSVDATAEQIVQRVTDMASGKGAKGNVERLEMLKKSIPQSTWDEMSSSIINKMGRAAEDAPFSGTRFVTAYDNLSDRGRQLLFGTTPWVKQAVDDIYQVSQAHKRLMKFGNPSGTGRVNTLLGIAGTIASSVYDPMKAAGVLVGGPIFSQLLATPVGAKSVTAWGRAYEAALALPSPGNLQRLDVATRVLHEAAEASKKNQEPARRATGGSVLDNMAEARAEGGRTDDANMRQPELRSHDPKTLREALPAALGKVWENIPGVSSLDPNVERRGMDVGHRLTKILEQSPAGLALLAQETGAKTGEHLTEGQYLKALGTLLGGGAGLLAPFGIRKAFGPGNKDVNIAKTLEEMAPGKSVLDKMNPNAPGLRGSSDFNAPSSGLRAANEANGGAVEARANGGSTYVNWTANNSTWQQLSPYQKAAAMALMEADRRDPESAKNALGAMINRAARSRQDLGSHVSQRIYQPTIEPSQQARLPSILKSEQFRDLAGWAERRAQGQEPDPVQGATHFLAPERTMLALEARNPSKYKSWRKWTKYDAESQSYPNVVLRDQSHAFLAPEGRFSAPYHGEGGGEGYRPPSTQDQATLDRLIADTTQRGAMDDLVRRTTQEQPQQTQQPIPETDKANLAKMIQGFQKQPEMVPLAPIQPVQLGSPTPIAPVTPYDVPRADGGGVLNRFKKKADGGKVDFTSPEAQEGVLSALQPRSIRGEQAELRAHEPVWYDKLTNYLTDKIYGENATAKDREMVSKFVGPENPYNVPAQVTEGYHKASEGLTSGDLSKVAMGALGMAGGVPGVSAAAKRGIRAYHGSPHEFEKFDISKIGTGEGNQTFGHGLYFAENEAVARNYRDALSRGAPTRYGKTYKGTDNEVSNTAASLMNIYKDVDQAVAQAEGIAKFGKNDPFYLDVAKELKDGSWGYKKGGHMYEVNIKANPDHFLDWDKPLSQQGAGVTERLREILRPSDRMPKEWIEHSPGVEKRMREVGIPGIRYLDQGSRGSGKGTYNYVVFDPNIIEIMRRYGIAGTAVGGGLLFTQDELQAAGIMQPPAKKADGGPATDGPYGDEEFKWPEQAKPQSGWDRDIILPFARKVEDGQVVKGGGILGSDWHFATPQAAYDALNTALHVGTSSVLAPFKRDPETREKMIEMAGSVVGPQAGVGMARVASGSTGLGSHGGKLPTPKAGPSLDPLGYYSQALEAAKAIPQSKGTPEQMLAQLKKAGVKDAEIAATGLDDYLSGKTAVTKDDLINHLNENRVALTEAKSDFNPRAEDPHHAAIFEAQQRLNAARDELSNLESGRISGLTNRGRINELRNEVIPELRRQVQEVEQPSIGARRTKWERYSLDPNNPTYQETVLHLPVERRMGFDDYLKAYRERFPTSDVPNAEVRSFYERGVEIPGAGKTITQKPDVMFSSGHFSEPNIVGHLMTSMNKHEGKPVFTLDQIQSDWGQKLRDGGVRDEAKIANLRKQIAQAEHDRDLIDGAIRDYVRQHVPNYDNRWMNHMDNLAARDDAVGSGARALQSRWDEAHKRFELANAEKYTAEAATPGHPLVNTTDQWTNTVLRRALTQAIDQGADYIAIPSGETVLSYNPGDAVGMMSFYGQPANRRAAAIMRENGETGRQVEIAEKGVEGIVPKNLRNILKKIDPEAAQPMLVNKLETPTIKNAGQGFTLFPITDKVRKAVTSGGLPLFQTGIGAQPVNPYEDKSVLSRFRKDRQP